MTRVSYCVFTDPGGNLPAWLVNKANSEAIPDLFEAVGLPHGTNGT